MKKNLKNQKKTKNDCEHSHQKDKKTHIGQIIRERVDRSGYTITEFADKINFSRPAIYQMFQKQSIDTELLVRISLLLKENLVKCIYQEVEKMLAQEGVKEKTTTEHKLEECSEYQNTLSYKLEQIHQDLLSIKDILMEVKEAKV